MLLPELTEPALGCTVTANSTAAAVQAPVNAGISGGGSGAMSTGTLKGAALGAGEALAFAGVHFAKGGLGFPDAASAYSPTQIIESAGMHAMVGGLSSMASGGK